MTKIDAPRTVIFLLTHSGLGGTQEIWANIAEGFRRRGHKVRLCALYPHSGPQHEMSSELPWEYLGGGARGPRAMLNALRNLWHLLRVERPSHIFSAMPAANVLAPLVGTLGRFPTRFVISHHTTAENYRRFCGGLMRSWDAGAAFGQL